MKRKFLVFLSIAIVLLIVSLAITSVWNYIERENSKEPKALLPFEKNTTTDIENVRYMMYENLTSIMIKNDKYDGDVVSEYLIADQISLFGIDYLNLKVFSDGSGELVRKFFDSEWEEYGDMVLNKKILIGKDQVATLSGIFTKHNFWDIVSIHPDESMGLDGNVIFIEALDGSKHNFISMWSPGEDYAVRKIYDEFTEYAELLGLKNEFLSSMIEE